MVDAVLDGLADDEDEEGATGKAWTHVDGDGDGFGASDDVGAGYCDPPAGVVTDRSDCDDSDASAGSSLDDADCDGVLTADDCNDGDAGSTT